VAVKIRLMRVGKKKQPAYRVVVADGRAPRDGRFIEIIGQYAPRDEPSRTEINVDSALAWLRKGAQPTEQVQKLLSATGVWAQYESELGHPAKTKLSRRGYMTGKLPRGVKTVKAEAPAPSPVPAPESAPPAAESADLESAEAESIAPETALETAAESTEAEAAAADTMVAEPVAEPVAEGDDAPAADDAKVDE